MHTSALFPVGASAVRLPAAALKAFVFVGFPPDYCHMLACSLVFCYVVEVEILRREILEFQY